MRETEFENGEYYHIYNRGVDQREIFVDESDYDRFVQNMFLFNDKTYFDRGDIFDKIVRLSGSQIFENEREPFVQIVAYTLLPNHYHFLLEQLVDGGISKFLHKLNKGYSRYFNLRYNRTGTLFQGPFKAKHLNGDTYASHIIPYIHLNILDHGKHDWREGRIEDWTSALAEMDRYKWSSHQYYRGKNQPFPLVDSQNRLKWFGSMEEYSSTLREWSSRNFIEELEEGLTTKVINS